LLYVPADRLKQLRTLVQVLSHVFSWGVPLACVISLLALREVGGHAAFACCFIRDASWGYYDFVFMYVPLQIGLLGSLVSFTLILLHLFRAAESSLTMLRRQTRLLLFILIYTWAIVIACAWRYDAWAHNAEYTASSEAWLQCIATQRSGVPNVQCPPAPLARPNLVLTFIHTLNLPSLVIAATLCLGTIREVADWWRALGLLCVSCFRPDIDKSRYYDALFYSSGSLAATTSAAISTNTSRRAVTPGLDQSGSHLQSSAGSEGDM